MKVGTGSRVGVGVELGEGAVVLVGVISVGGVHPVNINKTIKRGIKNNAFFISISTFFWTAF
jgi:hypothetical protein